MSCLACRLEPPPPSARPCGEAVEIGIAVSDAHAKTLRHLTDKGRCAFDRVAPSVHETRGVDEIGLVSRAGEADVEQPPVLRELARCCLVGPAIPARKWKKRDLEARKNHHVELTPLRCVACGENHLSVHLHAAGEVKEGSLRWL